MRAFYFGDKTISLVPCSIAAFYGCNLSSVLDALFIYVMCNVNYEFVTNEDIGLCE